MFCSESVDALVFEAGGAEVDDFDARLVRRLVQKPTLSPPTPDPIYTDTDTDARHRDTETETETEDQATQTRDQPQNHKRQQSQPNKKDEEKRKVTLRRMFSGLRSQWMTRSLRRKRRESSSCTAIRRMSPRLRPFSTTTPRVSRMVGDVSGMIGGGSVD
eukprot:629923-Rhodomonas_salina.1